MIFLGRSLRGAICSNHPRFSALFALPFYRRLLDRRSSSTLSCWDSLAQLLTNAPVALRALQANSSENAESGKIPLASPLKRGTLRVCAPLIKGGAGGIEEFACHSLVPSKFFQYQPLLPVLKWITSLAQPWLSIHYIRIAILSSML
jgi:hypothetical protein